jgi:hypothetical protein
MSVFMRRVIKPKKINANCIYGDAKHDNGNVICINGDVKNDNLSALKEALPY